MPRTGNKQGARKRKRTVRYKKKPPPNGLRKWCCFLYRLSPLNPYRMNAPYHKEKVTPTLPLHQTTLKAMQLQCGLRVHPLERANVRSVFRDQFRIQTPEPIDNVSSSSASELRLAADTHTAKTKNAYPAGRSDCNNCHYINTAAVTWLKQTQAHG